MGGSARGRAVLEQDQDLVLVGVNDDVVLAALLALCNGLSSAQLAAAHPVAGGTYEYGYKFLHPKLGFTAGWMFLLAKSASAADSTAPANIPTRMAGAGVNPAC